MLQYSKEVAYWRPSKPNKRKALLRANQLVFPVPEGEVVGIPVGLVLETALEEASDLPPAGSEFIREFIRDVPAFPEVEQLGEVALHLAFSAVLELGAGEVCNLLFRVRMGGGEANRVNEVVGIHNINHLVDCWRKVK